MTTEQIVVLTVLAATVALFLWGRWRHDVVAFAALLGCVVTGLVPSSSAFAGFGHPAVVTVACVLILSHAIQLSGAVDVLAPRLVPNSAGPTLSIACLTVVGAVLSGFINNVGALALLPMGLQVAHKHELPPGRVLMPLAFESILGGMTTMIGTPPNLIVSGFRQAQGTAGFGMFDFTPVGIAVALSGVAFIVLTGRWLVPAGRGSSHEDFDAGAYLTEVRIGEKSSLAGETLAHAESELDELDAQVVGLIRRDLRVATPHPHQKLRADDILVIEAEPEALAATLSRLGLKLAEDVQEEASKDRSDDAAQAPTPIHPKTINEADGAPQAARDATQQPDDESNDSNGAPETTRARRRSGDDVVLGELVVMPDSALSGRSATDIQLRTRFGINLLAVSRQGKRSTARLRTMPIRAGDVLLLQGATEALAGFSGTFGCIPLAARTLRIPDPRRALTAGMILVAAVSLAALGLVPASIGFAGGALAAILFRLLPLRDLYTAIDWPVIVLLAALIPVAGAVAETGAAELLARILLDDLAQGDPVITLALILIVTMTLSDFMNNAATAAVMCPIALGAASQLDAQADPFLMAVAVGASCAFLTPIGHQNNTLILGPGGFGFGDYWRLGLPLEIVVIAVGVPAILFVWPL